MLDRLLIVVWLAGFAYLGFVAWQFFDRLQLLGGGFWWPKGGW